MIQINGFFQVNNTFFGGGEFWKYKISVLLFSSDFV